MTRLKAVLGDRLLHNEPLARYTAARLGGPAEYLYIAKDSLEELVEAVTTAWTEGIPVRVLGGGANVLVSDSGVRGLIVINHVSEVTFGDWHHQRNVSATSGTGLIQVAHKCQSRGLSGLEWAASVPGTVGGAIVNNAGAHGGDIAGILADVVVLEADNYPQLYNVKDLEYGYRYSRLKARADRRFVILLATFTLSSGDPAQIATRMRDYVDHRKQTQPPGASLGSIFKNPPGDYAGRLIEAAGLKGYQIGGAQVSSVHANFFINTGSAAAGDYYALIRQVRHTVQDKMGVNLEAEIEIIGEFENGAGS
jgi:UDP-N-acetylmuramate dehydrogenase